MRTTFTKPETFIPSATVLHAMRICSSSFENSSTICSRSSGGAGLGVVAVQGANVLVPQAKIFAATARGSSAFAGVARCGYIVSITTLNCFISTNHFHPMLRPIS